MNAVAGQSALAEVDPLAWDDLLEELGCADAYLLREYVEGASLLEPGRATFLHLADAGGDVVFACLVREIPDGGGLDVVTPYGYGGPVAVGERTRAERFYELYDRWCVERRIVTTFVRFHPLFTNHRLAPPRFRVETLAPTIGWRLDAGDLLGRVHQKHRNVVRKALSAGVKVTAQAGPPGLADFVELYEETMRRQQAAPFYFFPAEYWQRLAALGRRLVRFDAVLEGELVASALCLATRPWLHYHLGATSERARTTGASNLVLYEAARWAQGRGFTRFHLGGGVGGRRDSLYEFKRRFDPAGTCEVAVGKAVHDPARYAALAGEVGVDGFFPAYRRPR